MTPSRRSAPVFSASGRNTDQTQARAIISAAATDKRPPQRQVYRAIARLATCRSRRSSHTSNSPATQRRRRISVGFCTVHRRRIVRTSTSCAAHQRRITSSPCSVADTGNAGLQTVVGFRREATHDRAKKAVTQTASTAPCSTATLQPGAATCFSHASSTQSCPLP